MLALLVLLCKSRVTVAKPHRCAVGEMAWLNSWHVTLKAVGPRKLLPQWLGTFELLDNPTSESVNYTLDIHVKKDDSAGT